MNNKKEIKTKYFEISIKIINLIYKTLKFYKI